MNQAIEHATQQSFGRSWLRTVAFAVLAVSLCVAPFFNHAQDVYGCWLNWARVTDGTRPWNLYLRTTDAFNRPLDCNYPPLVLYVLTAVQFVLNLFSLPQFGQAAVAIVKIPSILSLVATGWVLRKGLAPQWGQAKATRAALCILLCVPIWFNAAIWGQWDAPLCLAIVSAVVATLGGQPRATGAAVGIGLSLKLQAIVIVPAVTIYAMRTWRLGQLFQLVIASAAVWTLIALPFFITGAGRGVFNSYFAAIDHYPMLSVCAGNVWMFFQTCTAGARSWSFPFGRTDDLLLLGSVTAKQFGLGLFGFYTAALMLHLFRKPTPQCFLHCAAMSAFGFYMLPTEMHERYLLPACAIFAILAADRRRLFFFILLSGSALINQFAALLYENQVARHTANDLSLGYIQCILLLLSIANAVLFLIGNRSLICADRNDTR